MTPSSVADWIEEVTTSDTWAQVVARAWADAAFEARLMSDPTAVLYEAGLEVPTGLEVRVEASEGQEALADRTHLVLPPKPTAGEYMEELLLGPGSARGCKSAVCGPNPCGC